MIAAAIALPGFGRFDDESGLFGRVIGKNRIGHDRNREHYEHGSEQRANDLVKFK